MKLIMYSKSIEARTRFVRTVLAEKRQQGVEKIAYLAPKKFIADLSARLPEVECHAFEDVTKSNALFNRADDRTLLVLDRASRYKLITSNTFVRLSRLTALYRHKVLLDIVPFTTHIQYLYSPLAFIDRGILGYQHWYSFRENNLEQTPEGPVRAFDYHLLARKMAPYVDIDYREFVTSQVQTINCPMTPAEAAEYQQIRDRLFAENKSAQPIITGLADWTNIRPSRYTVLRELLAGLRGRTVCYTNLAGHNRRLQKAVPGIEARSFYDANGQEHEYDNVILFEAPIVGGYLFLDILANIRPDCNVYLFRCPNSTVDKLLYLRMREELTSINAFVRVLYETVHSDPQSGTQLTFQL